MVKKVILTTLFLLLTTGIFGVLNTKTKVQAAATVSCSTTQGWPGTCTRQNLCDYAAPNIAWDPAIAVCKALGGIDIATRYGCCGTDPNASTNVSCSTTQGWPGTCTIKSVCNFSDPNTAWDGTIPVCLALNGTQLLSYGCCGTNSNTATTSVTKVCDFAGTNKPACDACMGKGTAAWTALGCIPTDPSQFISQILGIGIGIGGGIAFLLILFGGFQILTSAGNPEHLNAGKELVTSAITGLLIIIFSIFLLRLIGVNIFAIPEFK